jgi:cytochrome c-type biogenesis protein CcmH
MTLKLDSLIYAIFLLAVFTVPAAWAGEADPATAAPTMDGLDDPVLVARYQALTEELRCLVCQNQNIAESNAGLAVDLREQVREQLLAGRTDDEILEFLTVRYGDFVRYRPAVNERTWLLWAGPLVFLGFGLLMLVPVLKRRAAMLDDEATGGSDES